MSEKLTFEGADLDTITINGQEWLRGGQIGYPLGLANPVVMG